MPGTTICSTTLASCSGGLPTAISEPSIVTRKRIFLSPPFSHFPSGFSATSLTMTKDEVAVKELVAPIHPPSESYNFRKPVYTLANRYALGPGQCGVSHAD